MTQGIHWPQKVKFRKEVRIPQEVSTPKFMVQAMTTSIENRMFKGWVPSPLRTQKVGLLQSELLGPCPPKTRVREDLAKVEVLFRTVATYT